MDLCDRLVLVVASLDQNRGAGRQGGRSGSWNNYTRGIARQVEAIDLKVLLIRLVQLGVGLRASAVHAVEVQARVPVVGDRVGGHELRRQRERVQRQVVIEELPKVGEER